MKANLTTSRQTTYPMLYQCVGEDGKLKGNRDHNNKMIYARWMHLEKEHEEISIERPTFNPDACMPDGSGELITYNAHTEDAIVLYVNSISGNGNQYGAFETGLGSAENPFVNLNSVTNHCETYQYVQHWCNFPKIIVKISGTIDYAIQVMGGIDDALILDFGGVTVTYNPEICGDVWFSANSNIEIRKLTMTAEGVGELVVFGGNRLIDIFDSNIEINQGVFRVGLFHYRTSANIKDSNITVNNAQGYRLTGASLGCVKNSTFSINHGDISELYSDNRSLGIEGGFIEEARIILASSLEGGSVSYNTSAIMPFNFEYGKNIDINIKDVSGIDYVSCGYAKYIDCIIDCSKISENINGSMVLDCVYATDCVYKASNINGMNKQGTTTGLGVGFRVGYAKDCASSISNILNGGVFGLGGWVMSVVDCTVDISNCHCMGVVGVGVWGVGSNLSVSIQNSSSAYDPYSGGAIGVSLEQSSVLSESVIGMHGCVGIQSGVYGVSGGLYPTRQGTVSNVDVSIVSGNNASSRGILAHTVIGCDVAVTNTSTHLGWAAGVNAEVCVDSNITVDNTTGVSSPPVASDSYTEGVFCDEGHNVTASASLNLTGTGIKPGWYISVTGGQINKGSNCSFSAYSSHGFAIGVQPIQGGEYSNIVGSASSDGVLETTEIHGYQLRLSAGVICQDCCKDGEFIGIDGISGDYGRFTGIKVFPPESNPFVVGITDCCIDDRLIRN